MRRFFQVQLLCAVLTACGSGGTPKDGTGGASTGGSTGTGGSSTGTGGGSSSTGGTGTGGTAGVDGGACRTVSVNTPGFDRGTMCPRDGGRPCYAACDFDGEQFVGCVTGSPDFSECYGSCGSCPAN